MTDGKLGEAVWSVELDNVEDVGPIKVYYFRDFSLNGVHEYIFESIGKLMPSKDGKVRTYG